MKNAFVKDCFRQVRATIHRFFAILIITLLGVAFLAGLGATGPDMQATAQGYFEGARFMDVHIMSTIGFNDDDMRALGGMEGLTISPAYSYDALASSASGDKKITARLHSIDDTLNKVQLTEGRMPEAVGECLVNEGFLRLSQYHTGDVVTFDSGTDKPVTDALRTDRYKIVGVAQSPLYISLERSSNSVGSGRTEAYFMLPVEEFTYEVYTDVYAALNDQQGLSRFDAGYKTLLKPYEDTFESVGEKRADIRYNEIQKEARDKLDDAQRQIDDAEKKLSDAQTELDDARKKLAEAKTELADGWKEYSDNKDEFDQKIKDAQKKINDGNKDYNKGLSAYNDAKTLYDTLSSALRMGNTPQGLGTIAAAAEQVKDTQPELAAVLTAYAANPDDPVAAATAQGAVKRMGDSLTQSKSELSAAKKKLDDSQAQLNTSKTTGQRKLNDAKKKLADAEIDIADGKEKIADGEQALRDLKIPKWYVLNLSANAGFEGYKQDSERIRMLSFVIPLLFFLVAALVAMTSMTRLVDSDRTYIGTYKALGYSNAAIAMRYLLYALSASAFGSAAGLIIGFNLFPTLIFNAYSAMYSLPPVYLQFNIMYAFSSVGAAILSATLPGFLVCVKSLKAAPADLMRPEAPKVARRTILERVKIIWKRLNFSQKIAVRNMFRYKKRLFMTIFGVAGCTALMFVGFALRDAVGTISDKQFGVIDKFDAQILLNPDLSADDIRELNAALTRDADLTNTTGLMVKPVDVYGPSAFKSAGMIIPADVNRCKEILTLRERIAKTDIPLNGDGMVISEKLSALIGVSVGDMVRVGDSDDDEAYVRIDGITENYLSHYAYMSPEAYKKAFQKPVDINQVWGRLTASAKSHEDISAALLNNDSVNSVSFMSDTRESFAKTANALTYVVLVLIISAVALVFVVLFSLTTINMEERNRELATIKVLGFFDRELAMYIYRETSVLTVIGAALGLLLGVGVQRYILMTVELDIMMFSRDILWPSYVYSAGLTFVFALIVNLIMLKPISKIDMVSSLKSVE